MRRLLYIIGFSLLVVCLRPVLAQTIDDLNLDHREEMRNLVKGISNYARAQKPDFIIIVRDAPALLIRQTPYGLVAAQPATDYMRSIDGLLQDGVWYGVPESDQPIETDRTESILTLLELAKENGLAVLVQDYVTTSGLARTVLAQADEHGFIGNPASGRNGLTQQSSALLRPHKENAGSVISLDQVRNFREIRNSSSYGSQERFALNMRETNHDLLIADVYHGQIPLTKSEVAALKFKHAGGKRLVLSRLDVSKAVSSAYYWQDGWQAENPTWIVKALQEEPGRYRVKYWQPGWQSILYGDTRSYIYGLIDQGFDGVVLEGANGYRSFEGDWGASAM